MWLVGVDEGHRAVVEAEVVEMSEWWDPCRRTPPLARACTDRRTTAARKPS